MKKFILLGIILTQLPIPLPPIGERWNIFVDSHKLHCTTLNPYTNSIHCDSTGDYDELSIPPTSRSFDFPQPRFGFHVDPVFEE